MKSRFALLAVVLFAFAAPATAGPRHTAYPYNPNNVFMGGPYATWPYQWYLARRYPVLYYRGYHHRYWSYGPRGGWR